MSRCSFPRPERIPCPLRYNDPRTLTRNEEVPSTLRSIGSAIVGYLAIFLVVFISLTAAYLIVGVERAFRPGAYEVSTLWVVISLVVGIAAAVVGGWVARRIAGRVLGPQLLAGLVFVLGIAMAVPALTAEGGVEPAAERTSDVGPMEAMQNAKSPLIAVLLNPLIGVVGVLVGGGVLGRGRVAASHQLSVASD